MKNGSKGLEGQLDLEHERERRVKNSEVFVASKVPDGNWTFARVSWFGGEQNAFIVEDGKTELTVGHPSADGL